MKNILMVALLILLAACSKTEINEASYISGNHQNGHRGIAGTSAIYDEDDTYDGPTILGEKIGNIYSVKNLIKARGSLGPSASNYLQISSIKGTHMYIRFLPADDTEYCQLLDKGYELFTEPLDYEIEKSGWYYHDPSIADTLYTWQYTTLPINTVLPSVRYEILDTMCMMESPSGQTGPAPAGALIYEIWEKLVYESGKILGLDVADTGHTGTPNYTSGPPGPPGAPGTRWTPNGRIMVYDYLLQRYLPLEGLRISITDGWTHAKAVTGADGTFRADKSFKAKVWYRIKWENNDWSIKCDRIGKLASKKSNGKINGRWDVYLKDNIGEVYSNVHRALMRAYYKEYLGMERPKGKWRMLKVVVKDKYDPNDAGSFHYPRFLGMFPDIKIYAKSMTGSYNPTSSIIRSTSHEIGHAVHYKQTKKFNKIDDIIVESWASAVGMYITEEEYYRLDPEVFPEKLYNYVIPPVQDPHPGGPSTKTVGVVPLMKPDFDNKQAWPYIDEFTQKQENIEYSPLFIDLVDSSNQQLYFNFTKTGELYGPIGYWKNVPYDNIQGIAMDRIQWAVFRSRDFETLRTNIKTIAAEVGYSGQEVDWFLEYFKPYWVK